MSINQRKYIRFSLDLPALRCDQSGEKKEIVIQQISVGGCLLEWEDSIYTGDVFRLEIQLPNKNWLPLKCKALYRFENSGIGAKFLDITKFEQELVGKIISHALEQEGLPTQVDPFAQPPKYTNQSGEKEPSLTDARKEQDELLGKIMSSEI